MTSIQCNLGSSWLIFQDGNGSITTKEVGTALRSVGTFPTEAEIQRLIEKDVNVSLEELMEMIHLQKKLGRETNKNIGQAFQVRRIGLKFLIFMHFY